MVINLYNNKSPKKKIGKNITLVKGMTGTLRKECDIINPSIEIENAGAIVANYAYIPDFERYYFITKITSVRNGLWRIDMHVDVRESFSEAIKNNKCILSRSSGYYNMYLEDNMLPLTQDEFNTTYALGRHFTHRGLYLVASDSTSSAD